MTQEQIQTAKEILEHDGYMVIISNDRIAIIHQVHEAFKLQYIPHEDKIYMVPIAGLYSAKRIKQEFDEAYETMITLNFNGIPVAM